MTYGVEGFRRCICMNGKIYAEVAGKDEEEHTDLGELARGLVDRVTSVLPDFLGHEEHAERHDAQWQDVVNGTPAMTNHAPGLLHGLHVDTYNNASARFATSLLYLRSPPANNGATDDNAQAAGGSSASGGGGETLFAADAEAGAELLSHGAESTLDDKAARHHGTVRALEASARALVPPATGSLLLFFVRDGATGSVDPAGFHGSARPIGGDKWTLQTFWAAPPGADAKRYARERHECVAKRLRSTVDDGR